MDPILLADIKGGSLYQQMYCEDVMANLSLVVEKYQDRLSHLEEIEIRQLFEGNATIINTRTDNCLQSFHISIMNADHWCTELFLNMDDERGYYWCLEVSYTNALDIYYRCIGAGGSTDPNCPGCPVPHED